MSQTSNADVLQTFKRVYGDLTNLLPEDFPLAKYIPFSEKQKVGERYVEAVVLTNETGWTLSDSTDAFELNPNILEYECSKNISKCETKYDGKTLNYYFII